MAESNKYFYLIVVLFIYDSSNGQNNFSNTSCDSIIRCQDIDVINLKGIKTLDKRPVIEICYSNGDIKFSVTKKNDIRVYYLKKIGDMYLLTWADSLNGTHKHKHLYDSILIKENLILQQTKYFTPDKILLSSTINMLSFDQHQLYGEYVSFQASNEFSISRYISDRSDSIVVDNSKGTKVTKKEIRLEKNNLVLSFLGKSLFWHIHNFFLDFYTLGVK